MRRKQSDAMTRAVQLVMAPAPHGLAPKHAAAACGVKLGALYAALKRSGHSIDQSAARKRALADPAVRAKMSAARKRALADPAVRAKISAARKRALADPAVRAKMSAARERAWADPAVRAKMSAASKRALADPAVRAKMSAASKRAWAKKVVKEAGVALTRAHTDRAASLLLDGLCVDDAAIVLANEIYGANEVRT